jgi:small GTP-binding protein
MSTTFHVHKVILLGFELVGKSRLLRTFLRSPDPSLGTIAVHIDRHAFKIMNRELLIQLWDTAGQERFNALSPLYARGAACAILVFALDSPESWPRVPADYEAATAQGVRNFVVAANKADTVGPGGAPVSLDAVRAWCAERSIRLIRTSAATGANVAHLFQSVAEIVAATEPDVIEGINLEETARMEGGWGCV